ncbi:MAG: hypothetical protein AB7F19_07040 [Candidatus Babeliales bacterium]
MQKLLIIIALTLNTYVGAMEQSAKPTNGDSLLHAIIREMSFGHYHALTGIRMPGLFNPEKHLAIITQLIANGAPLCNRSHSKGTIFDTYWYEQKCTSPSCKEHDEFFGKLLKAILLSEAGKATTRKEQRERYSALETKIHDLLTNNHIDKECFDLARTLKILKKSAQGLPMPAFTKQ